MSSQQLYCPTATRSVNDKNVPNLVFALGMDLIRVDERKGCVFRVVKSQALPGYASAPQAIA